MKTNTVIAGSNGERIVTSTTETLRIPASEIRPGDWLLKHHGRAMRKHGLVRDVVRKGLGLVVFLQLRENIFLMPDYMVDVERTT